MQKVSCLVALLCAFGVAFAQNATQAENKSIVLKFDGTKLIEPEMNVSFAVERLFKSKVSYQVQLDYIFDSYTQNDFNTVGLTMRGVRCIPEIRLYSNPSPTGLLQTYASAQLITKYVRKSYEEWVLTQLIAGQLFHTLKPIKQDKFLLAPHAMVGTLIHLDKANRAFLDFNVGFGIRQRWVKRSADYNVERIFLSFNDDTDQLAPSLASNLKVCYRFR
jgi:hypothetical protein